MKAFEKLEELARRHNLTYELGGGRPGMASVTARRCFTSGRGSRAWLVAEGADYESAAESLAKQIEEANE